MSTTVQVDQLMVEAVAAGETARVDQLMVEAVAAGETARVEQVVVEAVVPLFSAAVEVDQLVVEVLLPVVANAAPTAPGPFGAPVGPTTADTSIDLAWGAATDPDGDPLQYELRRRVNGGAEEVVRALAPSRTHTDTTLGALPSGSTVVYYAYAHDGHQYGPATASPTITIDHPQPPGAPTITGEATGPREVTLTLGAGEDATGHELYRDGVLIETWVGAPPAEYVDAVPSEVTDYLYRLVAINAEGETSASVTVTTPGFGTAPTVGVIPGDTYATIRVDSDPLALEVEYTTTRTSDGSPIDFASDTSAMRETHVLDGLVVSTGYTTAVRRRYAGGWSDTTTVEWETTDVPPDLAPEITAPVFGQIVTGTITVAWRGFDNDAVTLQISDDVGDTWSDLVTGQAAEGSYALDTTAYPDGLDYALRAVDAVSGDIAICGALIIDNGGTFGGIWRGIGDFPVDPTVGWIWPVVDTSLMVPLWQYAWWPGLYGRLYSPMGTYDGACVVPGLMARYVDMTTVFFISGQEAGPVWALYYDQELSAAGLVVGASDAGGGSKIGLVVDVGSFLMSVFQPDVCDNGISTATLNAHVYPAEGQPAATLASALEVGAVIGMVRECNQKNPKRPPAMRIGLRVRTEPYPGNPAHTRIRIAVMGLSVSTPEYWAVDYEYPGQLQCGFCGVYRWHQANDAGGTDGGYAVYESFGLVVLNEDCSAVTPPDIALPDVPSLPAPVYLTAGRPCALKLDVYEDDGITVAWSVTTDQQVADEAGALPYLMPLPDDGYGGQEVDFATGTASLVQVEVGVIDPPRTAGDQDTGWLTYRLATEGRTAIMGRRCRLIRYVSPQVGWVVIADGPAGPPRLDETYAAYRWSIRDTRERERKLKAFVAGGTTTVLPMGVLGGFGAATYGNDLIDELVLTGTAAATLLGIDPSLFGGPPSARHIDLSSYWTGDPASGSGVPDARVIVNEAARQALTPTITPLGFNMFKYTWPNLRVLWRAAGSADSWTEVEPFFTVVADPGVGPPEFSLAGISSGVLADGTKVQAASSLFITGALPGLPAVGAEIDVVVLYTGEPTEDYPLHIEDTVGGLLRDLYDGLYSPKLDLDLDGVPESAPVTGIRYDPAALAALTTRVILRITEPVEDLRAWTEDHIYAPLGYAPALDNDGRISPVSQNLPADLSGVSVIDDAHTEPVPGWAQGDRICNHLIVRYDLYRDRPSYQSYLQGDQAKEGKSADRIWTQHVVYDREEALSIELNGDQPVELDATAFSGIRKDGGGITDAFWEMVRESLSAQTGVPIDIAAQLALERKTALFDRLKWGAPIVTVPVMRSHIPTLRVGDWVNVTASWMPNYLTQLRGLSTYGQIIGLRDLNCAWREPTIELVPLARTTLAPSGGARAGGSISTSARQTSSPSGGARAGGSITVS